MELRIVLLFCLITHGMIPYAQDYWRPLEGPTGISIRNVATDTAGNVYFSSPEFGVFRSIDGGDHWNLLNEGLLPNYYSVFTFLPSPDGRMYAYNHNVFYRLNADQTAWEQLTLPVSSWAAASLNDEGALFLSDSQGNVFKSSNGGSYFQQIMNEDQTGGHVRELFTYGNGQNFMVSGYGDSYLYQFGDDGTNIELLFAETDLIFLDFYHDTINNTLLLSTGDDLLLSNDEGTTWAPVIIDPTQSIQPNVREFRRHSDGDIYAFANSKFIKTTNGGEAWTPEDPFNLPTTALLGSSVAYHGENDIYWTNLYCEKQIFVRSTDAGQTWSDLTATFKKGITKEIFKDDTGRLFAKTCQQAYFIFSEDDGVNWSDYTINGGLKVRELVFNSANHHFAIAENDSLYRSTDQGASWTHLELAGIFAYFGASGQLVMSPSDDIFITINIGPLGFLKSSDNGESFEQIHPGFLIEFPEHLTFHPNGNIFYGGYYVSLKKSTDGGYHWEDASNHHPALDMISELHVTPDGTLFMSAGNSFYGNSGLYVSQEEGLNLLSNDLSDNANRVLDIESNANGTIFCAMLSGVYQSADNGDSWTPLNNGLPAGHLGRHLYVDDEDQLYLGMQGDVIYKSAEVIPGTNRITGSVWNDEIDDCLYASEPTLQNWVVEAAGDGGTFHAATDENGVYDLGVVGGEYEVTLSLPSELWESCFVLNPFVFPADGSTNSIHLDLPVQPLYQCPYLSIDISTPFLKRCQENVYTIRYCNVGTASVDDASVELTLGAFMEFVSAEIPPHSDTDNVYTFQLGTIGQGECGTFTVRIDIACEAEPGQEHCIQANLLPDFQCLLDAEVLSSSSECRPNESGTSEPCRKLAFVDGSVETESVRPDNEFISYSIRFQNTGADTVSQVIVEDRLSTYLAVNSISPGVSSHPYHFGFSTSGAVIFTFEELALPPSTVDEAASWGFVNFRVAQKENLPIGTEILNFANITFDAYPPHATNTTRLTVEQVDDLNEPLPEQSTMMRVAPNPAESYIVFEVDGGSDSSFILQVMNMRGQILSREIIADGYHRLERKHLPTGLYFYKLSDRHGLLLETGKFVFN